MAKQQDTVVNVELALLEAAIRLYVDRRKVRDSVMADAIRRKAGGADYNMNDAINEVLDSFVVIRQQLKDRKIV